MVFYGWGKNLYYQVGRYTHGQNKITWGDETFYHEGLFPQAVLSDKGVVVVVRSHLLKRRCSLRAGAVDKDDLTINWGEAADRLLGSGINPSIAIIDKPVGVDSTLIFFYESNHLSEYRSFYSVGKVNDQATRFSFVGQTERRVAELDNYKHVSVSANKEGKLVLLFRSAFSHTLNYAVGSFENGEIHNLAIDNFTKGYYPRVSLLNNGMVIEMHEAALGPSLVFKFGWLNENTIQLCRGKKNETGYKPSLACNDQLDIVEVHTTFFKKLKYRIGHLEYL